MSKMDFSNSSRKGGSLSNDKKISEYQATFTYFDRNCNGRISLKELGDILRSLGHNPTLSQVESLSEQIDDGSGEIDFEQFCLLMSKKNLHGLERVSYEEVKDALELFDKDDNQWIDSTALRDIVTKLGESLSQEDADELISLCDPDNTGSINLKDFAERMTKM